MTEEFYKIKQAQELYRTCWNIYPKLLKRIELKKTDKILDAGCGNGELAKHLKGFNLWGFDSDKNAVENAKKQDYKKNDHF